MTVRPALAVLLLACIAAQAARVQDAVPAAPPPAVGAAVAAPPPPLQPFVASYDAYNGGKLAGKATMQVVHNAGNQWRADLGIQGNHGFAGILNLNIQQSTVFDSVDGRFRPLSQSTVRKGLFLGKKISGLYDWNTRIARWQGDIKDKRSKPIALQDGDMNGLLIDLALIRDVQPGRQLQYRFVDGGRVRDHVYQVAQQPETVAVGDLSYDALRVSRVNSGNDETIFWVASGVPTPVRILQRDGGEDGVDLRLTEYQGVQ